MTRLQLITLGCCLLCSFAACNKQSDSGTASPVRQTATYSSPSQEVTASSTMLGAKGSELAEQAAKASPEQLELVRTGFERVLPAHELKLSSDRSSILPTAPEGTADSKAAVKGHPFEAAVATVAGKLLADKAEFSDLNIDAACEKFLDEQSRLDNARAHEAELAANRDSAGRTIESIENRGQGAPKLDPAASIVGKWKSIKEISQDQSYLVNHNSSYHEELEINSNGTLRWIYYRNGGEFSNDVFDYDFDSQTGVLTLKLTGGGVYQTLTVYTTQYDVGKLYLETPGIDRYKVFEPFS